MCLEYHCFIDSMSAKELLGDDTKLRCPVCHYDDMNFTLGMKNAGIGDVLDVFDLHDEAMPDHDLAEFVESCTPEELLSWRNNGRTVFQEAVYNGLSRTLECLFNGRHALPEDVPDEDGNYSVHVAAAQGHLRVAAFLAARLPDRHFLKRNKKGESSLVLAAASLKLGWVSSLAKEHFFDLLSLTPDEALPDTLTSAHKGENVFKILVDVGTLFWPYALIKLLRGRERGEEFLCLVDSQRRNIAHHLAMRQTPWTSRRFSPVHTDGTQRRHLAIPSSNYILDALPEAAFRQIDSTGCTPWHCAVASLPATMKPGTLLEFLLHTPFELRVDEDGCPRPTTVLHRVCVSKPKSAAALLRQFFEELPHGSVDEPTSSQHLPLFTATFHMLSGDAIRLLVEHMTDEGLMTLRDGETFVHHFVRGYDRYYGRDQSYFSSRASSDFVSILRNEVAERTNLRQLLAVHNNLGQTAADLALILNLPGLAKVIRPSGAKRAL